MENKDIITFLLWDGHKPVARILASDKDLVDEDTSEGTEKECKIVDKTGANGSKCDGVTESNSKHIYTELNRERFSKKIRSAIREFSFLDRQADSQFLNIVNISKETEETHKQCKDGSKVEQIPSPDTSFTPHTSQVSPSKPSNPGIPDPYLGWVFHYEDEEENDDKSQKSLFHDCRKSATIGVVVPNCSRVTLPLDLSKTNARSEKGVETQNYWEIYMPGLNIQAFCKNLLCKSEDLVCVKLGYPKFLNLTDENTQYNCPACHYAPVVIDNFLVCSARAKFRFTKTGESTCQTVILESDGYANYAIFDGNGAQDSSVKYDFVEVERVKFGVSFNKCQYCAGDLVVEDEIVLACGRSFHRKCLHDGKCPICYIPEYNITNIPTIVTSKFSHDMQLMIPNQLYGSCADNPENMLMAAKPISAFTKMLAKKQIERKSEVFKLEIQENFVVENLPELIKHTTVNAIVIAKLRQLKVLSEEDEDELDSIPNHTTKCRRLYKIVPKRESGITSLLVALEETKQSGASLILSKFFSYRDNA